MMTEHELETIKADAIHTENNAYNPYGILTDEELQLMQAFEGKREKALTRKIDFRILPVFAFLYLLSHVDRTNLGNAKIEGMNADLGLIGNQYNVASTLFFIPYILFEIPSNMMLKRVSPHIWLTILILGWGVVMTLMCLVQNYSGLIACRIFLGVFEAGFFPGAVYIVSSWYIRSELQQRIALFYTASAFSGAFGGLLAFAISKLDGVGNIAGWRWIFLIEGCVTVAVGFAMPFVIPKSSDKAGWLTDEEKRFVDCRLRLAGVRATSKEAESEKFSWRHLSAGLLDWKVNLGVLMAWANAGPSSAFSFTMPEILTQLGYSSTIAQVMTIPPYFCGGVSSYVVGRIADRFSWRFPFIIGPMCVLLTGLCIMFGFASNIHGHVPVMYFGTILAQIGIYPLLPGISAWTGNNVAPDQKRSVSIAWLLAGGNLASLIGTNVFLQKEAPRYTTGYSTSIALVLLGMIAATINEITLMRCNRARAQVSEEDIRTQFTQEELDKQGDKSPLYKYTL